MMNETYRCPKCGQPVPQDAPEGLCPRCVGALNLDSETGPAGAATAAVPPPSAQELSPHFPHLEILEVIGQGGMGVVYKVRQKELDRLAALKILPPGIGGDPAFAERFAREAKALARLNHPGIVTIYDFGRADGLFYFLMEYVDGVSLGRLMRAGRMSPREALAIVPQLCDALQYAHDQGIVHRDIKPENILLDRQGRVKVADFGLAKLLGAENELAAPGGPAPALSPGLTGAGKVMGTPQYMAPEQAEHPADVDHRADIYALGVVFYQMLTGELPGRRLDPPSRKVQIDVRLDEVVLRALEKQPDRRYQQVSQVKTAVETIVQNPAPDAKKGEAGPESGAAASNWRTASSADGDAIEACLHKIARPSNAETGSYAGRWRRYAYVGIVAGIAAALTLWFYLRASNAARIAEAAALSEHRFHQLNQAIHPRLPIGAREILTQYRFQQLVDSNQIAEAIIKYSSRHPELSEIDGTYYAVDAEGKRLPEGNPDAKVPFRARVRLSPELQRRLYLMPHVQPGEDTPNPGPVIQVSATMAHKGDIGVWLTELGTVESSNSVMFQIPEDYCQEVVRKFDAHQELTVEAYDRTMQKKFGHGFLAGLDNRIDTQTGTLQCRARVVPEGDNLMIPGLFLNIKMLLEMKHGVTLVPAAAIQRDPQSAFLYVIQSDNTVTAPPVVIGTVDGKWAEIKSGLSPGELVATDEFNRLQKGLKVRYVLEP